MTAPTPSQLSQQQVLQGSYDGTDGALRVEGTTGGTPIIVVDSGALVNTPYDYIVATYPNSTTEVYNYYAGGSGGTNVATVTVVYTDSSKANISTVTKTPQV